METITMYYPIIEPRVGDVDVPHEEIIQTVGKKPIRFVSINVVDKIHPSWLEFLSMRNRINDRIKSIFKKAYEQGFTIYPLPSDVFNVFSLPIDRVKVVIVGQDPYPGFDTKRKAPVANGLAFATDSLETPGSLQRIRDAIVSQFGPITIVDKERPNNLRGWMEQGVFLLNNTPIITIYKGEEESTCRIKAELSQPKRVWDGIAKEICQAISAVNPQCRFILVGKEAHYLETVVSKCIKTNHPSMRSDLEFSGACFREIPTIDWSRM
jgi:uracil-DNA glycosylase